MERKRKKNPKVAAVKIMAAVNEQRCILFSVCGFSFAALLFLD